MRQSLLGTIAAILALLGAAVLFGCGDDPKSTTAAPSTHGTATDETSPTAPNPEPSAEAPPASCPPDLSNCKTASGTIVYVERVDPDGDGDAHFVLASDDDITFAGISVIDVSADLRPQPLPAYGTPVSAAGPVYPGSYGQRQIEAVDLHIGG